MAVSNLPMPLSETRTAKNPTWITALFRFVTMDGESFAHGSGRASKNGVRHEMNHSPLRVVVVVETL